MASNYSNGAQIIREARIDGVFICHVLWLLAQFVPSPHASAEKKHALTLCPIPFHNANRRNDQFRAFVGSCMEHFLCRQYYFTNLRPDLDTKSECGNATCQLASFLLRGRLISSEPAPANNWVARFFNTTGSTGTKHSRSLQSIQA